MAKKKPLTDYPIRHCKSCKVVIPIKENNKRYYKYLSYCKECLFDARALFNNS